MSFFGDANCVSSNLHTTLGASFIWSHPDSNSKVSTRAHPQRRSQAGCARITSFYRHEYGLLVYSVLTNYEGRHRQAFSYQPPEAPTSLPPPPPHPLSPPPPPSSLRRAATMRFIPTPNLEMPRLQTAKRKASEGTKTKHGFGSS
jgi:hypothetical protein